MKVTRTRKLPRGSPYISTKDICLLLGMEPTSSRQKFVREMIVAKIRKAGGRLDRYDPRVHQGSLTRYHLTVAQLKQIWPGIIDDDREMADELKGMFEAIQVEIKQLDFKIQEVARLSRARDNAIAGEVNKILKLRNKKPRPKVLPRSA